MKVISMKKFFLLPVLIFLFIAEISFTAENSVYKYGLQENTRTYIFGDNARIRKNPEVKKNNIIDSLTIGEEVTVTGKAGRDMTIDGYRAPWYKISYKKNNRPAEGYIWGGLLSMGFAADRGKLFLMGIKSYNTGKGFTGECRLVVMGKVISTISFDPHYMPDGNNEGAYGYSLSVEIYGSRGLGGLKNVLRIYFNYEACGYPRGNVWIGCSDDKLYYIGRDTSVSEAGVFHVEEKYIFPDENKIKGQVILVHESSDFDEAVNDYRLTEKKETRFTWENYKLNPVK